MAWRRIHQAEEPCYAGAALTPEWLDRMLEVVETHAQVLPDEDLAAVELRSMVDERRGIATGTGDTVIDLTETDQARVTPEGS